MVNRNSIPSEALYAQLKQLADSEPDLAQNTSESARWLGRLHVAVTNSIGAMEAGSLRLAADNLGGVIGAVNRRSIRNTLYRALAKVESDLPQSAQGGFIAAGDVFDALTVLASVLVAARKRVLFVDPYMGPEVLFKYAVMVPERVQVDLLGAQGRMKVGLSSAKGEWLQQYGDRRPLRIRQADAGLLHDRLIIIDGRDAWDISQSLNAMAKRSPATIAKSRDEHAKLKVDAYAPLFEHADVFD